MSIPEGIECVSLKGKQHPLYGSVLLYAQQKCHLRSLEVELVQAPSAQNGNIAICTATATFAPPDGEAQVYTDVGDASPASASTGMLPHIVRLASTRSKGRALRDGCGITTALYEEMASEETAEAGTEALATKPGAVPVAAKNGGRQGGSGKFCQFEGCGLELYPGELKESWDSFKNYFCRDHREQMRRKLATRPAV